MTNTHDEHPMHAALIHDGGCLRDGISRIDAGDEGRHDVAGRQARQAPDARRARRATAASSHQVTPADDSQRMCRLVEHRERRESVLSQKRTNFFEGRAGAHGAHRSRHDVGHRLAEPAQTIAARR
jgi:hypothetical protein